MDDPEIMVTEYMITRGEPGIGKGIEFLTGWLPMPKDGVIPDVPAGVHIRVRCTWARADSAPTTPPP